MSTEKTGPTQPIVLRCPDADAASRKVADLITEAITAKPAIVLGLATGATPIQTYEHLVAGFRNGRVDFRHATSFNLDEYIGLEAKHPQSYRYYMQQHLFDHVNFSPMRTYVPDGCADDPVAHASAYDQEIGRVGGIDLQLLGIGRNGHIGFNEPGSPAASRTRVVDLAEVTIKNNARYFDSPDQVPKKAITMGIGTIFEAKQIVMLATGASKAKVIRQSLLDPPTESVPASLLQLHSSVTFVLDEAAASELPDEIC
ncbi:glucosamine-6-phosphate deaminase [Novipirellula artificiosorum]|uniref:Glucosamine-6-phosphate deaminase n=1 Tax=Novipirellula artificiosorum TaxID=2528016 RepID=A0A5C6DUW7_9BACT|nr:glucosamine-6-phosphate deaminase [Novipirellula artificiosorum]TWU40442.1 Glucosamine-6-phosphate deaminase 1 [Novipirellula artificiosorum]